jgi:hypothetical protein
MMIVKQKTRVGKIKFRFVVDMRKLNEITVKDSSHYLVWIKQ